MKWVDCTTGHPEINQRVLVFAVDTEPGHPYFVNGFLSIGDYKGDDTYILKEPCYPYKVKVLKWMRIPPLPGGTPWNRLRCWLADLIMPTGLCVIDESLLSTRTVQPLPKKAGSLPVLFD